MPTYVLDNGIVRVVDLGERRCAFVHLRGRPYAAKTTSTTIGAARDDVLESAAAVATRLYRGVHAPDTGRYVQSPV